MDSSIGRIPKFIHPCVIFSTTSLSNVHYRSWRLAGLFLNQPALPEGWGVGPHHRFLVSVEAWDDPGNYGSFCQETEDVRLLFVVVPPQLRNPSLLVSRHKACLGRNGMDRIETLHCLGDLDIMIISRIRCTPYMPCSAEATVHDGCRSTD